jgi:tRNA A-37 threonylcarbamoyl transferase component Bud32
MLSDLTAFDLALSPAPDGGYAGGQVLADRYELTRIVGRGGTADVWVARDSVLDIDVAAKIVLPNRDDLSTGLRERTIQEARLCAQLTDPAVCRVLDFGFTDRGDPFVVSELLSGESLDDRLNRECRLGAVEAVRLLLPILDALGAAHKREIVHRDVKPANVFLTSGDGRIQPKLLDFGIACSSDVRSRMTLAGAVCGTPCYMSPEQACGSADIDYRSDLWSFCVMLYETVTGDAPFFNDNANATLFAIANQTAPSLASLGCDSALSRIVERGMEKDRDARWPSALELADALARWLADQGVESDIGGISLRRRFLGPSSVAAPLLLDVVDEVSTDRAVTFVPERRQRWAGVIALVSTLAAMGLLAVVVVSVRPSMLSGVTDPRPAAVAPVVRPPLEPPLPISEGVRTDATVTAPIRKRPARHPGDDPVPASAHVATSQMPMVAPSSTPELLEPPSFPPASPFSSSRTVPISTDKERPPWAAPPAEPPKKSRVRSSSAPRRDFGI